MNISKRVKGCCKSCRWSDFEGAYGKNQKLVCQFLKAPHGRYPSYTLKECPEFVEAPVFNKKRNAQRLKYNQSK